MPQTVKHVTAGLVSHYVVLPRSGVPAARTVRGGVGSVGRDVLQEKLDTFVTNFALQDV